MLRIIIALMSTTSMQDETYNQSVKDWWGIVSIQTKVSARLVHVSLSDGADQPRCTAPPGQLSQVQWVQVIPLDTESLLSTESQSM